MPQIEPSQLVSVEVRAKLDDVTVQEAGWPSSLAKR